MFFFKTLTASDALYTISLFQGAPEDLEALGNWQSFFALFALSAVLGRAEIEDNLCNHFFCEWNSRILA